MKSEISGFTPQISNLSIGGHEGTRTPNFLLVREAVYQLTYMPETISTKARRLPKFAVKKPMPAFGNPGELQCYENFGADVKRAKNETYNNIRFGGFDFKKISNEFYAI